MELLNKIITCEQSYSELTSNPIHNNNYIKYVDNLTSDIPLQNYIYIKKNASIDEMRNIVTKEKMNFFKNKGQFLRFVFDPFIPFSGEIPELSEFIFNIHSILVMDLTKTKVDFADSKCFPVTIEHKEKFNDLYTKLNSDIVGTHKHVSRWIDIKLNNPNLHTIVYLKDNNFIGNCELYIYRDIVKLDDFEVLEEYRKKRVGDALLKSAISISKSKNLRKLYILSDTKDWVNEYYQRRGFELFTEYSSCTLYR